MANGDITVSWSISGTVTSGDALPSVTKSKTFSSIADVFDRVITIPTSAVTSLAIGATVAGATLSSLSCLIIANLDASNYLQLGLIDAGAKAFYAKIKAGESFMYCDGNIDANVTGGAFAAFTSIDSFTLQANTAPVRARIIAF